MFRILTYVFLALCACFVGQLSAQSPPPVVFELGFRAGVPFHSVLGPKFEGYAAEYSLQNLERAKFAVGPTISAILYNQVQIEFGALYKRAGFQIDTVYQGSCADPRCTTRNPGLIVHESGRAHLWEYPLNANYYFGERRFRPYFGGGVVVSQELGGREDLLSFQLRFSFNTQSFGYSNGKRIS